MMEGRILVTPEQLDNVANQFRSGSEQSQQLIARLNKQIQGMEGQWDGMTKQSFFTQFQESKRLMDQYVQNLNEIERELKAIATRFRQADQQA